MALAHTILTVLADASCCGYDISKSFEEGVGCFWKASQQQIYRELGKMEKQGWVCYDVVPQEGKPDKKIYRLTEDGEQELLRWFVEPSEPTPIREDLLVKVLGGPHVPIELLQKELFHRRQLHERILMRYREKEKLYQTQENPTPQQQFRYLTLRRGIRYEQSWIDWCDEVMEFLDLRILSASSSPGT